METTCCIVGGGPAGMMLGYLLARASVHCVVLERHKDFFRDFRGDTIHPSTMDVLDELGLLDEFLQLPHDELKSAAMTLAGKQYKMVDLDHLPTHCKFLAFIPQWDFLNFIASKAKSYPSFDLRMEYEAMDIVEEAGRVVGVLVETPEGPITIHADLVVGSDGRHSVIRDKAGFRIIDFGAPVDVLWTRIPKPENPPKNTLGYFGVGKFMVLIDRRDYYQCGYVIPKGKFDQIRNDGLDALLQGILSMAPFLSSTINAIQDWEKVKLLTVRIDRLEHWSRPGLLCIGDAAHAMSPVGGVGINLAIQDAVATANALADKLRNRSVTDADLAAIQERREEPTKKIQAFQLRIHKQMFKGVGRMRVLLALLQLLPFLRRTLAKFIGVGPLPEHVHTLEVKNESA